MKAALFTGLISVSLLVSAAPSAEPFEDAMKRATIEYTDRLKKAADELNRKRELIMKEKAPLLQEMRAAEDRIISAEGASTRLNTRHEEAATERRKLLKDIETFRKNSTYMATLAHDGLQALSEGLAPGEKQLIGERIQALQQSAEVAEEGKKAPVAIDIAEFLLAHVRQSSGGYTAPGNSTIAEGNEVLKGTFAFVGPETFFQSEQGGGHRGTVRPREGALYPVTYPLEGWAPADAIALFTGQAAAIPADSSHGKALRLRQTSGSVYEHVKKGGIVAYLIVVIGVVALIMILQKIRDLSLMRVDTRPGVQPFLALVTRGARSEAEGALGTLKASTRELFEEGLLHANEPKAILEERMHAVLLGQRLHFERRLPLLAVIATAAPLMGLLGTVVGMVKTFALITVFGTGNAGKLSSGISEVLVATEIGLAVAIPTLVAHGFLAHRIHKNLAMLERHALEFVTAVELSKTRTNGVRAKEVVIA
jgi:biopolymer transport protein ExbB